MSTSDVYIGMLFTLGIASAIISAIVCAMIAYQRGLNVGGWLVLGFFMPLFSILFITITPLNHEKLRERGIEARTHNPFTSKYPIHREILSVRLSFMCA